MRGYLLYNKKSLPFFYGIRLRIFSFPMHLLRMYARGGCNKSTYSEHYRVLWFFFFYLFFFRGLHTNASNIDLHCTAHMWWLAKKLRSVQVLDTRGCFAYFVQVYLPCALCAVGFANTFINSLKSMDRRALEVRGGIRFE